MDHGKGKIVMATVRLDIETEAFQINMETNTLMIPRLGITQTINQTNQFTIKNAEGTTTSNLEDMPQDSCHQHKDVGQISVIKHEPRISQPSKMCRIIRISAPNGIGEPDGPDILDAFSLLQTTNWWILTRENLQNNDKTKQKKEDQFFMQTKKHTTFNYKRNPTGSLGYGLLGTWRTKTSTFLRYWLRTSQKNKQAKELH